MGSGTTAYVAKQNKRRYIGFEIDREYCKKIKKRLDQSSLI
jgi:DNA modification methylase